VAGYTVGDFVKEMEGLLRRLERISKKLSKFDQDSTIVADSGFKKPICMLPIFNAPTCLKQPKPPTGNVQVKDLVETVEGMKGWVGDVKSKMSSIDSGTKLGSATGPGEKDD
jgi:hypothetical protein